VSAVFFALSQFPLLVFGQVNDFLTPLSACALVLLGARRTLDEQQVAAHVGAIRVVITGSAALMALGDYVI